MGRIAQAGAQVFVFIWVLDEESNEVEVCQTSEGAIAAMGNFLMETGWEEDEVEKVTEDAELNWDTPEDKVWSHDIGGGGNLQLVPKRVRR